MERLNVNLNTPLNVKDFSHSDWERTATFEIYNLSI